jgi:hypothetical protein
VTGLSQAPTVKVVPAAEGGFCPDQGCLMPAQLAMHVDGEDLPREYCVDCIVPRLGLHRAKHETIAYSDRARPLLGLVPSSWPDTPKKIEADHPGWHVWRSKCGDVLVNWVATRLAPGAGVSHTVICDSSEALRAALVDERMLAARGPRARVVITR